MESVAMQVAAYLGIGGVVGFLAGLLGVGGGMMLVPILVLVFQAKGFSREQVMHLSLATAMATMPFTLAASMRAHHARGSVDWAIVRGMLPGLVLGAVAGSLTVGTIPSRPLAIGFTAFLFYASMSMLRKPETAGAHGLPGAFGLSAFGAAVSFVASFFAAGAAFMTIPFMSRCSVPLQRAIGTASAIAFPLALSSSVGFVVAGMRAGGLPSGSLGYVYLPALAGVVAAGVVAAPWGARVSHRLPVARLRLAFALLFCALGIRMLVSIWK